MNQQLSGEQKDVYYVAVKLFLERGTKFLITRDKFGEWDLPGGRILRKEFSVPLEKVIARKVREELGTVHYKLGKPVVFMRHERREASLGKKVRIFTIGYRATYHRGKVILSGMHREFKWVSKRSFRARDFFTGGWLKGVQDYQRLTV